jgi:sortase family protein
VAAVSVAERRRRPSARFVALLLASVLVPASLAAGAVLLLANSDGDAPPRATGSVSDLAREASAPRTLGAAVTRSLRPVLAERGRAGVQPSPLEPIEGGVRPAPPDRISIPAAHLDTVVEPVGTREGQIEVPGIGKAGWYDGGARPGEPGRAVIIGHLDTKRGPGLFARIPTLEKGARIEVTDRRGDVRAFTVVGSAQIEKSRFPTDEVYGGAGRPSLVLVTCGGPFSEETGYRDNVLVFARSI